MHTPDSDIPAKPHHFMSKRLCISISLVLFALVLLLSYALCSLQVDRSTQAILADKNRFAPWTGEAMQGRMDLETGGSAGRCCGTPAGPAPPCRTSPAPIPARPSRCRR